MKMLSSFRGDKHEFCKLYRMNGVRVLTVIVGALQV